MFSKITNKETCTSQFESNPDPIAEEATEVTHNSSEEANWVQVTIETCEKGTQRPMVPSVPYKDQCERRQREFRADVIETMKDTALKYVCFEEKDLPEFMKDIIQSKKWSLASGLSNNLDVCANPTVQALI